MTRKHFVDTNEHDSVPNAGAGSNFPVTRWTLVIDAAGTDRSTAGDEALTTLYKAYYTPLYAFARRSGNSVEDANDLTQGFFAYLIKSDALSKADRIRGRLRSFLLGCFKNFISNEWQKRSSIKRGGNEIIVSLDQLETEEHYQGIPDDARTPDSVFEKQWAMATVQRVLTLLEEEHSRSGKIELFENLKDFLLGNDTHRTYADVALVLNASEGAIRTAVHRMRHRFRELFKQEIAETVANPADVASEIEHIRVALASA